ncbi:MAG: hypothetical protein IPG23_18885 [Burkholderiales bacterium]|nr:hypothetical protein [Burkholderiales bacterium]
MTIEVWAAKFPPNYIRFERVIGSSNNTTITVIAVDLAQYRFYPQKSEFPTETAVVRKGLDVLELLSTLHAPPLPQ